MRRPDKMPVLAGRGIGPLGGKHCGGEKRHRCRPSFMGWGKTKCTIRRGYNNGEKGIGFGEKKDDQRQLGEGAPP